MIADSLIQFWLGKETQGRRFQRFEKSGDRYSAGSFDRGKRALAGETDALPFDAAGKVDRAPDRRGHRLAERAFDQALLGHLATRKN
jgi:hypothetical protein